MSCTHTSGPMTVLRPAFLATACLVALPAAIAPLSAQAARTPAAGGYHSARELSAALEAVARANPRIVELTRIAESPGRRQVHAVRLAAGESPDRRPALLVIAGSHGPHLVGSEAALGVVRRLAAGYGRDTAVTRLLDRNTVYVIPRANPDAAEAFFAAPRTERTRNDEPRDDDRDGDVDEDGPDDLDADGFITMMRVADPAGEWMADSAEPALMRRADPAKGETGRWRLYSEGRDADGDERWNEDPAGGTDIGRNFSYDYPQFGEGAGEHPISAAETRAIARFFVDHPNIAIVYVLGPEDNLLKPWEARPMPAEGPRPGTSAGGPLTSVLKEDEPWFAEVARRYRKATGREKGPGSAELKGDPLSFAYFHMGRWAFGSRAWWLPEAAADTAKRGADSAAPAVRAPRGGGAATTGGGGSDPLDQDRAALRWLRANRPEGFVEWHEVRHDDFPGRRVEVGGFRPFVRANPPEALLDSVVAEQAGWVTTLGGLLPSLSIRAVKAEAVGGGLHRVTAEVANDGFLPTASQLGARVRWPRRVRVEVVLGEGQRLAGGRRSQLLEPIAGSGRSTELTWLVAAPAGSRITLRAESPVAGTASQSITLR